MEILISFYTRAGLSRTRLSRERFFLRLGSSQTFLNIWVRLHDSTKFAKSSTIHNTSTIDDVKAMGKFYETIPNSLRAWILDQKVFWIASAPLAASGHVNVSPKGGQYFGLIDEKTFWYMDLTGSGIETTSHLHEPGNGRITVMFNAFEGPPRILRLWGIGTVMEYGTNPFHNFVATHSVKAIPGTRSIIIVDIHQVGTSCGFSMPFYDFKSFRPTLNEYFEKRAASDEAGKVEDGVERLVYPDCEEKSFDARASANSACDARYWASKNAQSMDGLSGLERGVQNARRDGVVPIKKMVGPYAPTARHIATKTNRQQQRDMILVAVSSFCMGVLLALWLVSLKSHLVRRGSLYL